MCSSHSLRYKEVHPFSVQLSRYESFKDVSQRMPTLCLHAFGSCLWIDVHMHRLTVLVLAHADLMPSY